MQEFNEIFNFKLGNLYKNNLPNMPNVRQIKSDPVIRHKRSVICETTPRGKVITWSQDVTGVKRVVLVTTFQGL